MGTTNNNHRQYGFGEFTLDVDRGALLKGDAEVGLRRQSFDVLRYLVEQHGRLVTKDELLNAIWGNTVVTDGSLTQCLIDVRRAIGDKSRKMIRTVPRRGYIFEASVSVPANSADSSIELPELPPSSERQRWPVVSAVVVLVAAATAWWALRSDAPVDFRPPARAKSIAVLPFTDMSQAQDQGYFADGISEEILNRLAQSPDLHVIARTSSFAFKGKEADIRTIAEKLNVAYVLEGSVRRSDDRLRITTQLIDAATSAHLWSEVYDHETGDLLAVQTEIAAAVAQALRVELSDDTAAQTGAPENPEAYESYLQGRFFHDRRGTGDSERAAANFRRALDIDPTYGRAWAGLAGTFLVRVLEEGADTKANREAWRQAAEQALEHAPELAEVQVRVAQYYWNNGDRERAIDHVDQASALDPNHPLVLGGFAGYHATYGRIDLAIEYSQRIVELDPVSSIGHSNLGNLLSAAGRFDEALVEYRRALDLNPVSGARFDVGAIFILQERFDDALEVAREWPEGPERDKGLAMIYAAVGRTAEGDAALEGLMSRSGRDIARFVAEVFAYRGETDEAFKWLEKGRNLVAGSMPELGSWMHETQLSPFLIPLRDDPRWNEATALQAE